MIVMNDNQFKAPRAPINVSPKRPELTELPDVDDAWVCADPPKPREITPVQDWLSVPECAQVIGVSDKTMRAMLRKHRVPVLRLTRNIRVSRRDFEALLKKLRQPLV